MAKPVRLSPVEKAVAKQQWQRFLTVAHIHTLIGGDLVLLIEKAGVLLFIIGLAAHQSNLHTSSVKVIHGACRALYDVVGLSSITELQRASIEAGLLAIEETKQCLDINSVVNASVIAQTLIKSKGVDWSDFQAFIKD
jgi:hypothetical protein